MAELEAFLLNSSGTPGPSRKHACAHLLRNHLSTRRNRSQSRADTPCLGNASADKHFPQAPERERKHASLTFMLSSHLYARRFFSVWASCVWDQDFVTVDTPLGSKDCLCGCSSCPWCEWRARLIQNGPMGKPQVDIKASQYKGTRTWVTFDRELGKTILKTGITPNVGGGGVYLPLSESP